MRELGQYEVELTQLRGLINDGVVSETALLTRKDDLAKALEEHQKEENEILVTQAQAVATIAAHEHYQQSVSLLDSLSKRIADAQAARRAHRFQRHVGSPRRHRVGAAGDTLLIALGQHDEIAGAHLPRFEQHVEDGVLCPDRIGPNLIEPHGVDAVVAGMGAEGYSAAIRYVLSRLGDR